MQLLKVRLLNCLIKSRECFNRLNISDRSKSFNDINISIFVISITGECLIATENWNRLMWKYIKILAIVNNEMILFSWPNDFVCALLISLSSVTLVSKLIWVMSKCIRWLIDPRPLPGTEAVSWQIYPILSSFNFSWWLWRESNPRYYSIVKPCFWI